MNGGNKENMSNFLYHGSYQAGIQTLNAVSFLHGDSERKVVYLTDSIPYALFYIWDSEHNKRIRKYVTCSVKEGIVYYEEQFPAQLTAFYDGVEGYVYQIKSKRTFLKVENCESVWFSCDNVAVTDTIYIPNVYEEIQRYQKLGKIKVIRFEETPKEKINSLYAHIAQKITNSGLIDQPESEESIFYRTYFEAAWNMAVNKTGKLENCI